MDFSGLLSNPLVLGALVTTALNSLKPFLAKVDAEKLLVPYEANLHTIFLVLTFIVSTGQLALSGHLASLDLSSVANFITLYLPMLIGGKAMGIQKVNPAPVPPVS